MAAELTGRIREGVRNPSDDPSQWQVANEEPLAPGAPPAAPVPAWHPVNETPLSPDDQAAMMPETFVPRAAREFVEQAAPKDWKIISEAATGMATLPKRAIEGAAQYQPGSGEVPDATIGPAVEAASLPMGTGAIAGVSAHAGEAVLGAGPVRRIPSPVSPPPPSTHVGAATAEEAASKLADDLNTMRQSHVADKQEVGNQVRAMPPEIKDKAVGEKLYHAAEDPAELARLTPQERALFDQHVEPLRQEQFDLALEAKKLGRDDLIDDPDFMHRIAEGHAPDYDAPGSSYDPVTGTGSLPRTTSALQERKFYVIQDANGVRKVVTPESTGDITVWNRQTPTHNVKIKGDFEPGNTIEAGGRQWKVEQARTKEIEQHGQFSSPTGPVPAKYHKNAVANTADAIVRLRQVVRDLKFTQEVMKSPWWLTHAQRVGGNQAIPKGWRRPKMPTFHDWYVEPKIADVLDDFYQPGLIGPDSAFMALRNANQFFTGSMFWQPIPHIQNVGVHWAVGRGWDWIRPGPMRHFATDMARAMKAVVTQNHDYQRFLKAGGGLVSGGVRNADFYGDLARQLGMDVEKNWSQYAPLAKKLGIKTPHDFVAWWYSKMRNVLWQSSDLFMMHRYLELERKGYSTARAIRDAEKHIPNYRIPTHIIFGQNKMGRMMSQVAQESALALFMRYRYGQWRSYVNMMADIAKGSPEEKKEALGNAAALAVMGYVVYEALDAIYQKITGDPNAKLLRRGAMTAPHHMAEVTRGNMGWSEFLQSEIPMAGLTKEVLQQMFGRDLFTGRALPDAVVPRVEHAAKTLMAPYGTAEQALPEPGSTTDKYGKEKPTLNGRSTGRLALDTLVGGVNESERTAAGREKAKRERESAVANAERNPKGIIDRAYYGAKHAIFGAPPVAVKKSKEKKSHHNKEKGY